MVDIRDYISLSKKAISIKETVALPNDFKDYYNGVYKPEQVSVVRHFVINNVPFAFSNKPILYERLTQYIGDKLGISYDEVKLIGSAKTGFSMSPPPAYGRVFGEHSDLDFSLINAQLFGELVEEFNSWLNQFEAGKIAPRNAREEDYWRSNLQNGPVKIDYGFLDTNYIPNRDMFPLTKKINNSLWLVKYNLESICDFKVKKVTASVYRDWSSFAARLNRNTAFVMKQN